MFGLMKKAMVVAAVAGVAAAAPAVASADVWSNGITTPYSGTAVAHGSLTLTVLANGAETTCDVTAVMDLDNPGGVAHGEVTNFLLGADAGGTCDTTVEGCDVTAAAVGASLPWTISTSGTNATISGIAFANTYTGADCPLSGVPVGATGAITGSVSGNSVVFSGAGPLSSTFGPATVSGSVAVEDTSGNDIVLVP